MIADGFAAADWNPEADTDEYVETDDRKEKSDFVKGDLALEKERCR